MLGLADIDFDVLCLAALAHDHAGIDLFAGTDKEEASFLSVEQTVGNSRALLKGDQGSLLPVGDVAFIRRIAAEDRVHDTVALGIGQEIAPVADQAAGRDIELQTGIAAGDGTHIDKLALTLTQLLDYVAGEFFGHVYKTLLHGLQASAFIIILINDFRFADRELIAFPAHGLDQDGQMQLAAAGDLEALGRVRVFDTQGNIRIQLPVQAVTQVPAGDIFSFLACQRGIVDIKGHGDGGLGNLLEGDRHRVLGRTDGITDMQVGNTGNGNDGTDAGLLDLHPVQAFKFIELADSDLFHFVRIMVVDDHHVLIDLQAAVVDLADADPADILVIVNGGNQHLGLRFGVALGRGDIVNDRLEQGLHAGADTAQIQCRDAGLGRREHEGALDLFITGAQIHQQLQDLVDDFHRTRAGTVDLVDTDNDRQVQGHGLAQDEPGLGHGTFKSVNDQDNAVDHLQHTFDFAAEVRVAGGIDNVDLDPFIIDGCVLT